VPAVSAVCSFVVGERRQCPRDGRRPAAREQERPDDAQHVPADRRRRGIGRCPRHTAAGGRADRGKNVYDSVWRVRVDLYAVVDAGRRQRLQQVRAVLEQNRRCTTSAH